MRPDNGSRSASITSCSKTGLNARAACSTTACDEAKKCLTRIETGRVVREAISLIESRAQNVPGASADVG